MKQSRIPTLFGIFLLTIGIAAGILLIKNEQFFRLGAEPEISPANVRISNVSDSSFTVSWTTGKEVQGFVLWGNGSSNLDKSQLNEEGSLTRLHYITVQNLRPSSDYYFKINSGGIDFDNGGAPWKIKTGPVLSTDAEPNRVFGKILNTDSTPAKDTIVYLTVAGSALLSSKTTDDGNYVIQISMARSSNLSSYIPINDQSSLIEITAQGSQNIASAQIYPLSANPVPPIVLGQVHDFKNFSPDSKVEIPDASIDLPKEATQSSETEIEPTKVPEKNVTLDNISEGEILEETKPNFLGIGPPGITLTITIESEVLTDQIIIDNGGNWEWIPPTNLEAGIHKITINWQDAAGILQTISRSFVVQAAEITSAPSPSPTLIPTPTFTPTPTPSPSPTPTVVPATIPAAGNLTPTLLLSIMSLTSILLAAFILLYKKA